jgi:hypothetical protein
MNPNEPGISQTAIGSELRAAELKIKTRYAILLFSIGEKLEGMSRKPGLRLADAKPILQFFKFMDNRFFTAERSLTFQVDAQLAYEKRRWDNSSETFSTFFTDFMRLNDKFCEAQRTRKSNKDFTCTTLDVWDRLHIAIEYS